MHVKPFGFDRVFRFASAEPPKPVDAEAEARLEALKEDMARLAAEHEAELARARADGFSAGLWQARNERDAALLAAVDALSAALEDMDERLVEAVDGFGRDAAEVALAAAEALAGRAVALAPAQAIDEALGRALGDVARGTPITITVHPSLLEDIERHVAERKGRERRRLLIAVVADAGMTPGDARIFWEEGGLHVDAAARRAAVMAELAPLLDRADEEGKDSGPARIA